MCVRVCVCACVYVLCVLCVHVCVRVCMVGLVRRGVATTLLHATLLHTTLLRTALLRTTCPPPTPDRFFITTVDTPWLNGRHGKQAVAGSNRRQ